jgi:hypothetical protein
MEISIFVKTITMSKTKINQIIDGIRKATESSKKFNLILTSKSDDLKKEFPNGEIIYLQDFNDELEFDSSYLNELILNDDNLKHKFKTIIGGEKSQSKKVLQLFVHSW